MINNVKSFITDYQKDLKYLFVLTIFLLIITIPKLLIQYNIGIANWDSFLYLENGRNFAKMGWGDVPSIAPVLPVILSKMFLIAGTPYQEALFNIDALFYIISIISFYLLLRLKFNENISIVGSVIFSTFTLLYSWVAIGGNDVIGVCGTILSMYLIFVSHKYNYKLYYLALPIAAYSFLSRYTAGVMIFSILFYLLISRIDLNELKEIIVGGLLGVISISWFLYEFNLHLGTPFPFLGQFSGTVANTIVLDSGYLPDSWYYIKHVPNYLISYVPHVKTFNAIINPMGNIPSIFSYLYILLFILAFLFIAYKICLHVRTSDKNIVKIDYLKLCISIVLMIIFILTLSDISYIISSFIFLVSLYLIWNVLSKYQIKDLEFDLTMISLFVTYLIFQSILFTKNDRYFITVLPFIAYFITYSLNEVFVKIRKIEFKYDLEKIISAVIIIALLLNTFVFISQIPTENKFHNIEESCDWLMNNRNITNKTLIYSDNWPAVSWYINIYGQRGVINTSNVSERIAFSKDILIHRPAHKSAAYYIDTTSKYKYDFPGLKKIKNINTVEIYENKYLKNGREYLETEEYNKNIYNDIIEYNRTSVKYV